LARPCARDGAGASSSAAKKPSKAAILAALQKPADTAKVKIDWRERPAVTFFPRLLILETSGRIGQVALALGDTLLAKRRLEEARRHARDLAPAVADLLRELGWRPGELHAVIVSRGPGSYTGLRVGVMSAKTLAYATGCVLLGIDTFAAIALQAPDEADRLAVLGDAQQDKIYVQSFVRTANGFVPLDALTIRPFAEWLASREVNTWVTGPGLHKWEKQLPVGVPVVGAHRWEAQLESLLRLGLARYEAGERDDPWMLEPLYLRPSSAEEQWQRREAPKP
jgi:tRNA threonylcarbamoyladenosine biosynthesis protein TsaB